MFFFATVLVKDAAAVRERACGRPLQFRKIFLDKSPSCGYDYVISLAN